MISQFRLQSFTAEFNPVPETEQGQPSIEFIKRRIRESLSESNILRDISGHSGAYQIDKVVLTNSAIEQIRATWWGHRDRQLSELAPPVELKFYAFAYSSGPDSPERIDVEILPGLDSWEVR